jgi:hypothetical protein
MESWKARRQEGGGSWKLAPTTGVDPGVQGGGGDGEPKIPSKLTTRHSKLVRVGGGEITKLVWCFHQVEAWRTLASAARRTNPGSSGASALSWRPSGVA